jgi:hypothetical protein
MAGKGSIAQGVIERIMAKAIGRLRFSGTNALAVTVEGASSVVVTTMPTTTVTGTVAVSTTVASQGAMSVVGTSQIESQVAFNIGFRRNLV